MAVALLLILKILPACSNPCAYPQQSGAESPSSSDHFRNFLHASTSDVVTSPHFAVVGKRFPLYESHFILCNHPLTSQATDIKRFGNDQYGCEVSDGTRAHAVCFGGA